MPAIKHNPMFVLQRKSDGVLMPQHKGRAGGTYVDPDKPGQTPRLFTNTTAAKNMLAWWAAGRVQTRYEEDWGNVVVGQKPVEGRNADDWEIVPIQICTLIPLEPMGLDNG